MQDYVELVGRIVPVQRLSGYVGDECVEFVCEGTKVRICKTEKSTILRWMDEFLDPIYDAEIVEAGTLYPVYTRKAFPPGTVPESCWVYGRSYNVLTNEAEDSDIMTNAEENK